MRERPNRGVSFTKHVIGELDNSGHGADFNTLLTVGDINSDGFVDVVVCGRQGQMVWFENPGKIDRWRPHPMDEVIHQECGGVVVGLTGSGFPDLINGGDSWSDEISWWENPGAKGGTWLRRIIAKTGATQFHDTLVGDITGDGRLSLVFTNQGGNSVYWAPLPEDPRVSPWPDVRVLHHFEKGAHNEGLAVADVDGDGRPEVIAATHWFKYTGRQEGAWEAHQFAPDSYISTKIAAGDINGDGNVEILLAEGDACIYGRPEGGRLAFFTRPDDIAQPWVEHVIAPFLRDPHSLDLGDICGNGRLDLLVGEIGVAGRYEIDPPRVMVFENDGKASFTRHIIDEGTGIHDARLVDTRNAGVLDIIGKPLHGKEKWKIHVYYHDLG